MSLFTITVPARHCAVEYLNGKHERVLAPGRHRRTWRARYVTVDLRDTMTVVAPQEVMTADGVVVKVSAVVRWAVDDAVAWLEQAGDPGALVYLAAQVALRDALAGLDLDDLTRRGARVPADEITAATAAVAGTVGVRVGEVVVRDVILPVEVRHAAAELVTARQRGLALLEGARAETAALRSLANGAKLLDAHPALAQLRLVQSAPHGTQVVLRVGQPDHGGEQG
ncbi:SPFH domain-containing protein [Knoellia koreensis]|uniref:Slipin family protein n=1 Tax=Knoellia koreensis TaxID=2730921 RepID=A0A849HM79_9MICO|nr:SPFH domain-containing protein [Knoellia sp. DB2414S]NNM47644.1 slipin family protein [Knoellia sp. DB2414S]